MALAFAVHPSSREKCTNYKYVGRKDVAETSVVRNEKAIARFLRRGVRKLGPNLARATGAKKCDLKSVEKIVDLL